MSFLVRCGGIQTESRHSLASNVAQKNLLACQILCCKLIKSPGTQGEVTMAKKIGRDAKTGRFITEKEAKRRPNTTVVETLPEPKKKGK